MSKNLQYYFVFIGPFDRNELDKRFPMGEGVIRSYVQVGYEKATGDIDYTCSSGWGVSEEQKNDAKFFLNNDEMKDQLVQSYFDEGKPFPYKALKAWYLLRKSEGEKFNERK